MGQVFGVQQVAEPSFEVLYRSSGAVAYEIRRYGTRFAAEATFDPSKDEDATPFRLLARYIGVFGNPENECSQSIAMTAPVVKQKPQQISMTAPVVKQTGKAGKMIMSFLLPADMDDMSKIPKPTNEKVAIKSIPPATGAVYRYAGSQSTETTRDNAMLLGKQLQEDGIQMDGERILSTHQFWGYNPPFTLFFLRRNEVWLELSDDEVRHLTAAATSGPN